MDIDIILSYLCKYSNKEYYEINIIRYTNFQYMTRQINSAYRPIFSLKTIYQKFTY